MEFEKLSKKVIGCAIEVHRNLGPGLLESAYEQCLAHELYLQHISFKIQQPLPVEYKGIKLDCGYRLDIVVDDTILIELKSVDRLLPIHEAQLLTYMKLAEIKTGFLMNFNVRLMKNGIKRMVL